VNYHITAQKGCDLAVIGGGGGGLVAAARAAWLSGKKVIVLEKADHAGGSALFAGAIRTFGSKWQKERGLPDVTHEFILRAMDNTYWRLDHRLVANCFRATGEFFDWFCEVGDNVEDRFEAGFYVFDGPEGPKVPLLKGSKPHDGGGKLIMQTMLDLCGKLGVEVLTKHKVVDVEVEDGRITAVVAETEKGHLCVACRACVLASGSWVSNQEVMKKIAPVFLETELPTEILDHHNPNLTGDGIALAEKVGAFLDYGSFCLRPMGPVFLNDNRGFGEVMHTMSKSPYSIMVNLNGKRWVCEPPQVRMGIFNAGHVLMEQPKGIAYAVFDENTLAAAITESRKPHEGYGGFLGHLSFPETREEIYANIEKTLRLNPHSAFRADTIEALAGEMGIDPGTLKETVAVYNASCEVGVDWEFFKPAKDLVPLNESPYYAVKGTLGSDGAFGGVRVNPDMQAYKEGGGLVEGLYVVGDFASGRHIVMGGVKTQVINDCSWAFASGFIAASSACKYLQSL
jgi:fumarate reductase flavoprotein subunit